MKRLHRTVLHEASSAPSLPGMYPSLAARRISIRRGECSMIAGQSGAGKSTLALALAVRAKVPTLYFSADTNSDTVEVRLASMLTDTDQATVEAAILRDRSWASNILKLAGHIRWNFDASLSMETVELEIMAHQELTSRPPELIVVDNLLDCAQGGTGTRWDAMLDLLLDFKYLAREYDTAFLILHHMTEAEPLPRGQVPPKRAIKGKLDDTPALILSVAADEGGFLGVSAVKNRHGESDVKGEKPTWLRADPSRMFIGELETA